MKIVVLVIISISMILVIGLTLTAVQQNGDLRSRAASPSQILFQEAK